MKLCPCGTQKRYLECCGLYLLKKGIPNTPEALMRSRYTAFVEGDIRYIQKTMQGEALATFNKQTAKKKVQWVKLEVLNTALDPNNSEIGFVEFKAYYQEGKERFCIHEKSVFHKINDRWFYVFGIQED